MEDRGEISAEWRVQSGEWRVESGECRVESTEGRGKREEFLLAVARSANGAGGYT